MRAVISRLIIIGLAFGFPTLAWSGDFAGQWDLKIEDQDHHVVTTLVIEFTKRQAPSCIDESWLRVNVLSATTNNPGFFPVSSPLSYRVQNNQLTIGRNEICDAFLWLKGVLNDEVIRGEYFSFGWGFKPLGFFVLSRKK